MTDRPALSKGELEVARVLWELKSASVRQVHETLSADREIDFTTVQTYLRRLESKGYAKVFIIGTTHIIIATNGSFFFFASKNREWQIG